MNRRTIAWTAVLLLLGAGVVTAAAIQTAVSGYIVSATGTTEKQWIDDDGVLHVRGYVGQETLIGDLAGTLYVTADQNLDLATGNGDQHGKLRFEGTWDGVTGAFEGSWSGDITGFYFDGAWVAQGSGGFDGLKLKVDNEGWLTPPGMPFVWQTYDGHVHNPHGD